MLLMELRKTVLLVGFAAVLITGCSEDDQPVSNTLAASADDAEASGKLISAIQQRNALLAANPAQPEVRFKIGRTYLNLGAVKAAEIELAQAYSSGVRSAESLDYYVQALIAVRKRKQAQDLLGQHKSDLPADLHALLSAELALATRRPKDIDAPLKIALESAATRRRALVLQAKVVSVREPRRALEILREAKLLAPENVITLFALAHTELRYGKAADSLALFRQASELSPDNIFVRAGLARAALATDDTKTAKAQIKYLASHGFKDNPELNLLRGHAAWLEGNLAEAELHAREFAAVRPDDPSGLRILGFLAAIRGNHQQAIDNIEMYLTTNPGDDTARATLANALLTAGDASRASQVLSEGLELRPDSVTLLRAQALEHMRAEAPNEAIALLQKALKIAPDNAALKLHLARAKVAAGQVETNNKELAKLAGDGDAELGTTILKLYELIAAGDFKAAAPQVEALARKHTEKYGVRVLAARIATRLRRPSEAREHLNKAIELKPDAKEAKLQLAASHLQAKEYGPAEAQLNRVIELNPNNVDALEMLALISRAANQKQAEANLLSKAFRLEPGRASIVAKMVVLHLENNNPSAALTLANQLSKLDNSVSAKVLLGRAELSAERYSAALNTFTQLTAAHPNAGEAHLFLAYARQTIGDLQEAGNSYARAIELLPKNFDARMRYASLLMTTGDFDKAQVHVDWALKHSPKSVNAWIASADLGRKRGQLDTELNSYRKALELNRHGNIVLKYGSALLAGGKRDEALTLFRDWLKEHPTDRAVRYALITAHIQSDEFDTAQTELDWLLKQNAEDVFALNTLANIYHMQQDKRALTLAEKAYKAAPNDADVLDTLGWILVEAAQPEKAIRLLAHSVQLRPDDGPTLYHLGIAHLKAGDLEQGKKTLQRSLTAKARFPEMEAAKSALKSL